MNSGPFYAKIPSSKPLPLISVQGGRYRLNLDHITSFELKDTSITISLSTGGQVLVTDKAEMQAMTQWLDRQSFSILPTAGAE